MNVTFSSNAGALHKNDGIAVSQCANAKERCCYKLRKMPYLHLTTISSL